MYVKVSKRTTRILISDHKTRRSNHVLLNTSPQTGLHLDRNLLHDSRGSHQILHASTLPPDFRLQPKAHDKLLDIRSCRR